jgi:Rrf2 family protein
VPAPSAARNVGVADAHVTRAGIPRHSGGNAVDRSRICEDRTMKVSAKSEYAVRAALELAAAAGDGGPLKAEAISRAQEIPAKFLESILLDLRRADLVRSQRGAVGGYWLAASPDEVSIADVIRAVDGPLAYVRGERPEQVEYSGAAQHLSGIWIALRASLRTVLEETTLADVLEGRLPEPVRDLVADPDSWTPH